jgi:hypothetical protein
VGLAGLLRRQKCALHRSKFATSVTG